MRKNYFKIFTFLLVLLLGFSITSDVKAKETFNHPEDIIMSYFNCINEKRYTDVQKLYGEELNEFVYEFFQNMENVEEHQGIYNVKNVTSEKIREIGTCEDYEYNEYFYSNIKKFFVKCNMNVYQTDKYYQEGVNYFIFYIGMNEDSCLKILNIEIPTYSELMTYDTVEEDIIRFQQIRDELIYGIVSPCYSDSPVYIDRVVNPTSIRVEGYSSAIPFWDYCKAVAANEINTLSTKNAARAGAMAIKMYSMHAVNKAASGANYDIKRSAQKYNPNTTSSEIATEAMEYIKNYFLLGQYGENFKTFYYTAYDKDTAVGKYAYKNGGVLSHKETNSLGENGKSWQDILRYYYVKVSGTAYITHAKESSSVIITTAHTHDWSDAISCDYCGALVD